MSLLAASGPELGRQVPDKLKEQGFVFQVVGHFKDLGADNVAGVARKLPGWKKRLKKAGQHIDKLKVPKRCTKQKVARSKRDPIRDVGTHIWADLKYGATAMGISPTQLRAAELWLPRPLESRGAACAQLRSCS